MLCCVVLWCSGLLWLRVMTAIGDTSQGTASCIIFVIFTDKVGQHWLPEFELVGGACILLCSAARVPPDRFDTATRSCCVAAGEPQLASQRARTKYLPSRISACAGTGQCRTR